LVRTETVADDTKIYADIDADELQNALIYLKTCNGMSLVDP